MDEDIYIKGFLDGEEVKPRHNRNEVNMFDGKKLDALIFNGITFKSRKDFKEIIDFLQIHKFCFDI